MTQPQLKLLQTITDLRVGQGSAVGAVDLPVMRETHTDWPTLPGSSLKGALRSRAELLDLGDNTVIRAFGSEAEDDPRMGELRFREATLLALPLRALRGTFVLVTCPLALARFAREAAGAPSLPPAPPVSALRVHPERVDSTTVIRRGKTLDISEQAHAHGVIIVEDLDLELYGCDGVAAWSDYLAEWCGPMAPTHHLALVHDDVFAHATRFYTRIRTRAAIGPDGVVVKGDLFTTEALPPETLLWTTLIADDNDLAHATLPNDGEAFVMGGHTSVGCGRLAWYGRIT